MIESDLIYYNRKTYKLFKRELEFEYSLLKKYLYSHFFVKIDLKGIVFYEKRNISLPNNSYCTPKSRN